MHAVVLNDLLFDVRTGESSKALAAVLLVDAYFHEHTACCTRNFIGWTFICLLPDQHFAPSQMRVPSISDKLQP